jgi:16S rRNA A1518/A1519 N6-dimethyltransferase RsmA/KsgA/DIM1 with predicted DNA glycosylase/AP lyase activity
MRKLRAYNRWIWSQLEPYVGNPVLEVGSGTGNISELLRSCEHATITDFDERYLDMLRAVFGTHPSVRVERFDLE